MKKLPKRNESSFKQFNMKKIIMPLIIILFLPVLINALMFVPISITPSYLSAPDWLAFWGSYAGGAIGGIGTLLSGGLAYFYLYILQ